MAEVVGIDEAVIAYCTCLSCASKIRYKPSELFKKNYGYDYLGDYSVGEFLKCPSCGNDIRIRRVS